jgi:VWFA-related protein
MNTPTAVALLTLALASAGPVASRGAGPGGDASRQSARDRERVVYVGAVNEAGAPVRDLTARDFAVREDGIAREVLRAQPSTEPIEIALVLDNSAAMESATSDLRQALKAFVQEVNARDPIAVITVADRPTVLVNYTLDRGQVTKAIDRVFAQPASGTRLLDALIETSRGIEKRGAERAAIVAVTSQGQEFSEVPDSVVVDALKASGAAFHVAELAHADTGIVLMDDPGKNRGQVLDAGPRASGGRHRLLLSSMGFKPELSSLAAELNAAYRVVYSRPETLIPPQKIEVTVKRPGVTARATPARIRPGA